MHLKSTYLQTVDFPEAVPPATPIIKGILKLYQSELLKIFQ